MSKQNTKELPKVGTREVRAFAIPDLRAADEGYVVEGHAAVFGQEYDMGYYTEVIARGAFDKTDFSDVLFCINHDLKRIPLARSRNNNANSTLKLGVDEQGLYTRAVLDADNNVEAKALYSSIKRGDMSGMSYIFIVRGEEWEKLDSDMPKRTITDIAVIYEAGCVSFPANPGTDISARSQEALESARLTLESARARAVELESSAGQEDLELVKLKARAKLLI
jgi:HK97 family phage prohead protease